MAPPTNMTRRDFLKSSALTATVALTQRSMRGARLADQTISGSTNRLLEGWEYHRAALGGVWDVWRSDKDNNIDWQAVQMPHCFNARDAVDPDQPYYEGPGWYRTRLKLANPFPSGRTLLHFEGAGQKSEIFVYLDKVGQ